MNMEKEAQAAAQKLAVAQIRQEQARVKDLQERNVVALESIATSLAAIAARYCGSEAQRLGLSTASPSTGNPDPQSLQPRSDNVQARPGE